MGETVRIKGTVKGLSSVPVDREMEFRNPTIYRRFQEASPISVNFVATFAGIEFAGNLVIKKEDIKRLNMTIGDNFTVTLSMAEESHSPA